MSDLDRITKELAAVDDAIWRLPDDAFAERYELLKQRDAVGLRLFDDQLREAVPVSSNWHGNAGGAPGAGRSSQRPV